MTILENYRDKNPLRQFLIKNLPAKIKAGTEKHNANIYSLSTLRALKTCPFININTNKRTSIMVFDIDSYEEMTAKEYFKDINGLLNHIINKIGYEPTYILETQKGFHFAYGLKNQVFSDQPKAISYLRKIKQAISERLGCDPFASNRLYGVWRNPLLHNHYFSGEFNYEFKDFYEFLPKNGKQNHKSSSNAFDVDKINFNEGNRNNNLFMCAMHYAKDFIELREEQILTHLKFINVSKEVGLADKEIASIASSVFKYWRDGKICFKKDINVGVMGFEKIGVNGLLTNDEYEKVVKRRQQLSARRTSDIRDPEKNKQALNKANKARNSKSENQNIKKVKDAIKKLQEEEKKITISAIANVSGLNRRTAKKYYEMIES